MAKLTVTDDQGNIMGEWIDGDDTGFDADRCVESRSLPHDLECEIISALLEARRDEKIRREMAGRKAS